MPDYDDENYPLTSSTSGKKFGSIRFRGSGISSRRRDELKAAISGPRAFGGGVVSTAAPGDAPLRILNGHRPLHHLNSASTVSSLPQQIPARGIRRNSDIPLRRQQHSSLAWPSNHPEITPVHGSPRHPPRAIHKKPRKVVVSKPLVLDSPHFSSTPGLSDKRPRHPTQANRGSRWSRTMASGTLKGNLGGVTSQELPLPDQHAPGSNLLNVPPEEFDPRTMIESFPALNLDLSTNAASFGSVKHRARSVDKALRVSRATLLPVPQEKAKPDLAYTDDSDAFSSPPSTPSTPAWETMAKSPVSKIDPKPTVNLELADVHAQIQAMIDSANRPFSTGSGDYLAQDQEPSNAQRNDIPPSLRPSNPIYRTFPRPTTTHKRSVSSPPLGSGIYHAYPPDSRDTLLYRPIPPIIPHKPAPPASPPPKTKPTSTVDPITPAALTRNPSSECSDSPSVYSQPSPTSKICEVTPTSSITSSPDHPYASSKHERLLAAISEGISSPTKPGPTAPSILGSGRGRIGKANLANPSLNAEATAVPMIVVTDSNDDDLVYSESSFSIVDMYAGSAESFEVGVRRRTRTANSVSHVPPVLSAY